MATTARTHAIALRAAASAAMLLLLTGGAVSCSGDPIGSGGSGGGSTDNRPGSQSMAQWRPSTDTTRFPDECPQSLHDSYYVVGPDGRKYPTWHPPSVVNPDTGRTCYFGHDHGENPAGSALWNELRRHFAWDANGNGTIDDSEWNNDRAGIPFGYAVEYASTVTATAIRHESWKIALANGVARQRLVNGNPQTVDASCDYLTAIAQDTDSSYVLGGSGVRLHPLTYAIDCRGADAPAATRMIVTLLADFGSAQAPAARSGETAPALVPPDAQTQVWPNAFVAASGTSDLTQALRERWDTIGAVVSTGGVELARINPGFVVNNPSRYTDAASNRLRSIDLCYSGLSAGGSLIEDPSQAGSVVRQVRGTGTECASLSATGPSTAIARRVAFDARDAAFKGCRRQVVLRDQSIRNGNGPATWYSRPDGSGAQTTSFSGAIRQSIAVGTSGTAFTFAALTDDASTSCEAATGVRVLAAR